MLSRNLLLAATLIAAQLTTVAVEIPLEKGFENPPREYGIRCWWWWLNGNVTKDAITRDLEAMKTKGFSGACIFDAGGAEQRGNEQVPPGPMYGSPEWTGLFKHAVTTADRLGLVLSLSIQSGWNLGGPDVSPAEATKMLTWSETVVGPDGPPVKLAEPTSRDGFYRDIAVLAIPLQDGGKPGLATFKSSSAQAAYPAEHAFDANLQTFWVSAGERPGHGPTPENPEWIGVDFARPVMLGGITLTGRPGYGPKDCELQVSNNGGEFRTVRRFSGANEAVEIKFDPLEAASARLLISSGLDRAGATSVRNVQISDLSFLAADGSPVLGSPKRVRNLREKAVFHELGGSAPDTRFLLADEPDQPGEPDARLSEVVNLTGKLGADGTLDWRPPSGRWMVLRFGYTCTAAHVSTSSGQWQGRVIDYMSEQHFRAYWSRNVEPLLREIGPLAGKTLTHLQTDSWELGGINWTDNFAAEFKKRRGYDVIAYLPIVAGKIIENRDVGTRFLADLRKTIADCVSDNHYGTFAKLAREHGMHIQPESAGPHAGPLDGLKNYQHSDIMMSEFWVPSPHRPRPEQRFFVKQAASAAHIYNGHLVGAESFTSIGPHWNDVFWSSQKPSFDHEMCSGLNLVLLHTFTCSPKEMGLPGQEYFAGTHFNPQVTWWSMSDGFISYLRRCQFVAQQGKFVADALYYYGDHVPNIGRLKQDDPAGVLPGYDYDLINEDVLLKSLSVKDGRLVFPHGQSYRVLVLPDHKVLSLAVARKVRELVHDGATVIGPKPERTVSLVAYPKSEREIKATADELWGMADAPVGERKIGKGRVVWGRTAREVLAADGLSPDFQTQGGDVAAPFDYIHYTLRGAHCYFVCNQSAGSQRVEAAFRVSEGTPELWDAVTGEVRPAVSFQRQEGLTVLPLQFDPYGSVFVVFRNQTPAVRKGTSNYPSYQTLKTIDGPWELAFEPGRGAPEKVRMTRLESWTENQDPGVKHFSGIGTYSTRFTLDAASLKGGRLMIQLNDIQDVGMARVKLNGKDCGVAWAPPFRLEVTPAMKRGENTIEISVANSWRNRLVGDRALPAEKRITRTNVRIAPEWNLLPSGLFGPVEILAETYE